MLVIRGSGSEKKNALLNGIQLKDDDDYVIIGKTQSNVKDLNGAKCQYLIERYDKIGLRFCEDPKALIEYSINILDFYKNIEDYNRRKKHKLLIVFQ